MSTKAGREIATVLRQAGLDWEWQNSAEVYDTLSRICRDTNTYTRLHEWLSGGHPVYGGEWINENHDKLEAKDDRLEENLTALGNYLATIVTAGEPRLETHSVYGVTITVIDPNGVPRERDMGK